MNRPRLTMISEFAYIEFCQKRTAVLIVGSLALTTSHILWDSTRLLGWSQNETEKVFLSNKPFDIMPCSWGYFPESILAWTVDVTAGKTGSSFDAAR